MESVNPYLFDRSLQLQSVTRTVAGDVEETWADQELDIRAQLIFAGGKDDDEGGQPLNIDRRKYKIMESGRSIDPDKTRLRETGTTNWYQVTGVTPWKGSKFISVVECVYRSDS